MIEAEKVSIKEKIGYALGDGAANIAWRGVATFLFVFYTDVFGISPVTVGLLMLVARFSDGITDVIMGIICDRTKTRYGKFRPWIRWTAFPLAISLSLLFTTPDISVTGKIVYAYVTYIVFTLIYTANNIPYGALMAVITGNDKERTVIGSYRMVGAFAGGMIVQGALLLLVAHFGNVNPQLQITQLDSEKFNLVVSVPQKVDNVQLKTKEGVAVFTLVESQDSINRPGPGSSLSFSMQAGTEYSFLVEGEPEIDDNNILLIDQKKGYSRSIYLMSVFLALFMLITFYSTKERVEPPKNQQPNIRQDLIDLMKNRPWIILLVIGLLFNVYNSIKQGIVVIYFTHYLSNQLLAGSYLVGLMLASIAGAMIAGLLGNIMGKRNLFISALVFSGLTNALLVYCKPDDIAFIFTLGMLSEFASAILPTLFFAMLGDVADYSEFKTGRRATGLVYSAGSFATKFGGGIAGALIGLVLGAYHYNGQDTSAIQTAIPGITMLFSWVPSLVALFAAVLMSLYPLNRNRMAEITTTLFQRRSQEILSDSK